MTFHELIRKEWEALPEEHKEGQNLFGLALSGGGIRSATFGLGVVQHLAQLGLLKKLHYLSTVSGGGYLGSWLAAWIKQDGIGPVQEALVPRPESKKLDEAGQIRWLRRYGKYLAPEATFFSADTWAIVAIWLRNTLLNLTVLTACLMAAIAFPWILELGYQGSTAGWTPAYWLHLLTSIGATALAVRGSWLSGQHGSRKLGIFAAFLICVSSIFYTFGPKAPYPWASWALGGGLTAASAVGMLRDKEWTGWLTIRALLGVAIGSVGMGTAPSWVESLEQRWPIFAPIMLPAVISFCYCLILTVLMGFLGRNVDDERREWWSRVGAWMFIFGWAWVLLAGVALVGPVVVDFLRERYYIGLATGSLWAGLTALGVYLGNSASTDGGSSKKSAMDYALPILPGIFVVGLLVLLARWVANLAIGWNWTPSAADMGILETWEFVWRPYAHYITHSNDDFALYPWLGNPPWLWPLVLAATLAILYGALGALIDINEFSMHRFYQNRLVRGFQGAARDAKGLRKADPFTNLDPSDDLKIKDLQHPTYEGPVHLVNTAINLNLKATGLEERRAASFVFTPYGCGYVGGKKAEYYQLYPDDCKLRLGTPVAASGAAASPNMGYHTSTMVAFLLTVFNVRLGYWIQNPNVKCGWSEQGPTFGQWYFLNELVGKANDDSAYVYLSDGGHFENLAVYELLRRRCKYIICVDGECDTDMKFEGLAGLVRKARSDMGIEIRIETADIEERGAGWSKAHCAVGRIFYPENPEDESCKLLYLKLSVTGDEPVDVLHYRKENPAFPHQTTGDQFFNESQFESYRRLGYHVAEHAFRPARKKSEPIETFEEVVQAFEALNDSWYGLPRKAADNFIKTTEAFDALMAELGTDARLAPLQGQLRRGATNKERLQDLKEAEPVCFYYAQRLLQLMENCYFDLDLESNIEAPALAGWKALFIDWKKSQIIQDTWQASRHIYSKQFVNFYERPVRP